MPTAPRRIAVTTPGEGGIHTNSNGTAAAPGEAGRLSFYGIGRTYFPRSRKESLHALGGGAPV